MDALPFFRNLKQSDWSAPATSKWKVKDVLSHLVGWEREVSKGLIEVFKTGKEPWFMLTDAYDDFNERIYKEFENSTPEELMSELKKWRDILYSDIKKIGEDRIRQRQHMDWVFDEGGEPHFEHHLKQIQRALAEKI